jgi:hypothetical protein
MKSSVGRTVHYVSYGTPGGEYKSKCRAAIIADVYGNEDLGITEPMLHDREQVEGLPNQLVALCVLNPTGIFFNDCEYSEDNTGGTWHWPERVD